MLCFPIQLCGFRTLARQLRRGTRVYVDQFAVDCSIGEVSVYIINVSGGARSLSVLALLSTGDTSSCCAARAVHAAVVTHLAAAANPLMSLRTRCHLLFLFIQCWYRSPLLSRMITGTLPLPSGGSFTTADGVVSCVIHPCCCS